MKILKRLSNAIIANKFNSEKYCQRKSYHGVEIETSPLFCSYGEIGYKVCVYEDGEHKHTLSYDWELKKLTIDELPYKDAFNLSYLEDNGLTKQNSSPVWENYPRSVELECYTEAGGDMLIDLEEPTRERMQEYIDGFDINHEVAIWWPDGKPGRGVPFANMREHWDDLEDWLKWLQRVCDKMPY